MKELHLSEICAYCLTDYTQFSHVIAAKLIPHIASSVPLYK